MPENTLALATGNAGKVVEMQTILDRTAPGFRVLGADDFGGMPEVVEDAPDFAGNARKKAEALRPAAPGCWILADDSGLEVDALNGAPGVQSARYAGEKAGDEANLTLLLRNLETVPREGRTARFRCVLCLLPPGEAGPLFFEGICAGEILSAPRGTGGFGYDPVFQPVGYSCSFAEISASEKNRLSHRGKALEALVFRLARGENALYPEGG